MTTAAAAPRDLAAAHARPARVSMVAASLDIIGGHGVQMVALRDALQASGYEVSFLPINPRFPRGLRWMRRVPVLRTLVNELLYLPSLRRVRHADVVHVFAASYWSFLLGPVPAIAAARAAGARVVLHYHSGEADDHLANWGALVHPWLARTDRIVVPSRYLQRVFASHGYAARVIPNIVDTRRFVWRDRLTGEPHLLSNRNLEPYYRVDIVIRAFALVRQQRPDARLTIAGRGSRERLLRALAAELGVADAVRFAGTVPPAEMPALLDTAGVFVNASTLDNQPVSILEAFAAGLPVVSTGTGDIADMLRGGELGTLVPPEDPAALAEGVLRILDRPLEAAARARRARAALDRYTWTGVADAWDSVYRECTASPRRCA
ncbi:MAG TPA: glycosyltransferase family 4 protein [Vicinamibacterales bacterium]